MPKMKTRRAAKKRYKLTANGKIKIKSAKLRHILTKKSSKNKRHYRTATFVDPSDVKQALRCLPYGT